jgi:hypothetical protein
LAIYRCCVKTSVKDISSLRLHFATIFPFWRCSEIIVSLLSCYRVHKQNINKGGDTLSHDAVFCRLTKISICFYDRKWSHQWTGDTALCSFG